VAWSRGTHETRKEKKRKEKKKTCIHGRRQDTWNSCLHRSQVTSSPSLYSSLHMTHMASSPAAPRVFLLKKKSHLLPLLVQFAIYDAYGVFACRPPSFFRLGVIHVCSQENIHTYIYTTSHQDRDGRRFTTLTLAGGCHTLSRVSGGGYTTHINIHIILDYIMC
jgi:hypothetical protein